MAVVLLIAGLLILMALAAYRYLNGFAVKRAITENRVMMVQDALSTFAVRNYRIPCPASPNQASIEPFGAERGSGAGGSDIPDAAVDCSGANSTGIVPFATLGLSADTIVDGWGNFLTYKIAPAYARNPENVIPVHRQCRSDAWIEAGRNLNRRKARFCCSGEDLPQDIVICRGTDGGAAACDARDRTPLWPRDPVAGGFYADSNIEDSTGAFSDRTSAPVFVLISHGPDSHGAYRRDLSGVQEDFASIAGTFEEANADPALRIVWDLPVNTQDGDNHFQDFLFWKTQDQLLAHLLGESCAGPQ